MAQTDQEDQPLPEKIWEGDPSGAGAVRDLAIDHNGKTAAAVFADDSGSSTDDVEVIAWRLDASSGPNDRALSRDPSTGLLLAPEGLGVVALEPRPGAGRSANYVAVGQEGTTPENQDNVYTYFIGGDPEAQQASYGDNAPTGVLRDLWFSDNGQWLLAQHDDGLALLKRGTNGYSAQAQWSTDDDERIVDADPSKDLGEIAVALADEPTAGSASYRVLVLDIQRSTDSASFVQLTDQKQRTSGSYQAVALAADASYLVTGTSDDVVFYYWLQTNENKTADADPAKVLGKPWTDAGAPGAVTALGIATDGKSFAAGFDDGSIRMYGWEKNLAVRPQATPLTAGGYSTRAPPSHITFTNQDSTIFSNGGGLYAFNVVQFDKSQPLEPLWSMPNVAGYAVSADGNRFVVSRAGNGGNTVVGVYEQSYEAELAVGSLGDVPPGSTTSVDVTVRNTGSAFDEYTLSAKDVPGSWSTDITPQRVSMMPGESETVRFNITPAQGHPPGDVDLVLEAQSRFGPGEPVAGTANVTVTVPEVHQATLETESTTADVNRGSTATLTITLTNAGNVDDTFVVEVDQQRSWDLTIDGAATTSQEIDVAKQETHELTIGVDVPQSVSQGAANELTVTARPQAGGPEAELPIRLLVEPDYGAAIGAPTEPVTGDAGEQITFDVTVNNAGNTLDTFTAKAYSNATNNDLFWEARLSNVNFELSSGNDRDITVTVNIPRGAEPGDATDVTIAVRSQGSGAQEATATVSVQVAEEEENGLPVPTALVPLALLAAAIVARRKTR